ncbi:hypothetical protein [Actinacidiphila glaucinigra]|uniref:hypothetical protein n=1 Tax=Actinacidiphila glaucinigra TaxID=235986 RepID=UPI003712A121
MSLGRHMNDKAISFYAENPSGFHIEIAWRWDRGRRRLGAARLRSPERVGSPAHQGQSVRPEVVTGPSLTPVATPSGGRVASSV